LTSLGRHDSAEGLAQHGFAACLTKPVRQSDLLDCLCHVLAEQPEMQPAGSRIKRKTLPALRRTSARILVAEDNIVNQEVALGILHKLGLQASAVENGVEAIEALRNNGHDLVLMDLQMPEMDGLEACRVIRDPRSAVHNHQIPIIAMTAAAMQGDRERCLEAGMNGYLTKPISPQTLVEALNAWLP
jgi:two-component system sensor histidine kinase/response regulator